MTDYAIVEHGGKQYRVSPGDELLVEVINRGSSTIDTTGFHLAWSNGADSVDLPTVDLRAGQFLVLRADASTVGGGSTFLIDAEGTIRKIWKSVKVDGHDEKVIAALKEL